MTDIDRRTGQPIDNYASALQSVEIIFTTPPGQVVLLREAFCDLTKLLGRLMVPSLFAVFQLLVKAAIDVWEPRFVVRHVDVNGSVDELRGGRANFLIEVDWRPRAHLVPPDFTVEGVRTFGLSFLDGYARAA
ncbi:hypothetical protein [Aurantimonas sp. VKM B-3413]|uniref:hypothetical protein n=1 Tax=Aurantimonas sp. VKM B-3413 TaxID=2779401 RepID=UPI001E62A71E|nr:hypothetical protein [Aurantimonas sp. VKM B-3413]MCB8835938.1 hypothetical protein [Aurantimonas sp. VKM B-3413]